MNAHNAAITNSTLALTVTAAQGDGTICTLTKMSGGSINAGLKCVSADGKSSLASTILQSKGSKFFALEWGMGDIMCLIGVNPTSSAAVMGSLASVPANTVTWSCTTNITGGGNTAPTAGSVSWP
jgi:hypothetical protein